MRARDNDGVTAAFRAHVAGYDDVVCLMRSSLAVADDDDLLTVQLDGDDRSGQPPESLYSNVRKFTARQHTTGNNTVTLGESEYQLASTGSGNGEKTTAAELVRRVIGEQLREVLGGDDQNTYIAPLPCSESSSSRHPSGRIDNIGYNTLTRVLREELQRFRADAEAAGQRQPDSTSNNSVTGTDGEPRRRGNDYEEIDDLISVINERDRVTELGDAPQGPPPAPPIPVDSSSTSSPLAAVDACRPAPVTGSASDGGAVPVKIAADSVRRHTAPVDDQSVIQLLERIEQSSAELDASFTALVNVGLRSPGDWQRLARQLPICKPSKLARRISTIEARYQGDTRRQAAAALAEWRSHCRDKATLCELVAALRRCDLLEEARFLDSMSQDSAC